MNVIPMRVSQFAYGFVASVVAEMHGHWEVVPFAVFMDMREAKLKMGRLLRSHLIYRAH
jgi:hypothetical protein